MGGVPSPALVGALEPLTLGTFLKTTGVHVDPPPLLLSSASPACSHMARFRLLHIKLMCIVDIILAAIINTLTSSMNQVTITCRTALGQGLAVLFFFDAYVLGLARRASV